MNQLSKGLSPLEAFELSFTLVSLFWVAHQYCLHCSACALCSATFAVCVERDTFVPSDILIPLADGISIVASHLDYCNSHVTGMFKFCLPTASNNLDKMCASDHIAPAFKSLHWLPIKQ